MFYLLLADTYFLHLQAAGRQLLKIIIFYIYNIVSRQIYLYMGILKQI